MAEYPPNFQAKEQVTYKVKVMDSPREVQVSWGMGTVCTIEDMVNGGEYSLWLSTVLKNKFKKLNIVPGDVIGIVFKGKRKNYYDWSVIRWTPQVEAEFQKWEPKLV